MISGVYRAGGTAVFRVVFKDEDGTAVVPNTATWTLLRGGQVLNNRKDVSITPAATVDIVLSGDDLVGGTQHIVIDAVYDSSAGSGLPLRMWASFDVARPPAGA